MASSEINPLALPASNEDARTLIQAYLNAYVQRSLTTNFDNPLARAIKCTSVTLQNNHEPARATFTFTIPPTYVNNKTFKTIHGGAVATFFDNTTSMAILATSRYRWPSAGVTRNLNVTYFRPPVEGEEVVVESEVVSISARMATITGTMRRVKDGAVLALCTHEKAVGTGNEAAKL